MQCSVNKEFIVSTREQWVGSRDSTRVMEANTVYHGSGCGE